jgi:hypothetical protein
LTISDDDLDTNRIIIKSNHGNTTNTNHHNSALDILNDLDNEEAALHEFDFLTGDAAAAAAVSGLNMNELKSAGKVIAKKYKMTEVFCFVLDTTSTEWDVDSSRINRLKEEYKRDRHAKQQLQSTTITNSTSASIRNSLLNNGSDDVSSDSRSFSEDEQSKKKNLSFEKQFIR